ncbi:MAG: endo-1,4-beta-xylanase [Candidatus Limnocylindrales bacterium]
MRLLKGGNGMRLLGTRAGSSPALGIVFVLALAGGCAGGASPQASGTAPSSAASPSPASAGSPSPALRDLAGSRQVGTAVGLPQLDTDTKYAEILAREFNSVTPENAMKWGPVERVQGTFDWSGADEIVAFAQAHGQKVRGHTLVWHSQLPGWLSDGAFTGTQLGEILKNHIATEVGRYAGKIYAWDVVNEAFADDGTWRDTIWLRGLGQGYVADAFRWAHAADPGAKLYINDYDVEGINAKSDALYNLVKSLKAQGVPIDGVGFQAHYDMTNPFPTDVAGNLKRFADLGVEVAFTELDARFKLPVTESALAQQATYYGQTVAACLAVPACVGVTVWGFTDKYSWVPSGFPGEGAACLLDENLNPKPAYRAVEEALMAGKP